MREALELAEEALITASIYIGTNWNPGPRTVGKAVAQNKAALARIAAIPAPEPVAPPQQAGVTEAMVDAACIAICRTSPNYSTHHFPGDEPREWRAQSGFRAMTHPLWGKSVEILRDVARAALTAALSAQGGE
jgi:hypothetical protein